MSSKQDGPCKITQFQFGEVLESIYLERIELVKPGPMQMAVKLLAAPINPSDLGTIMGTYGHLPILPAVPGREGVGEIYDVGELVDKSILGKRVRIPLSLGSWQESVIVDFRDLIFVPSDIPMEMAAMAFINPPTAWCLLHDFVDLKPGDWIIQNAANSAVGMCVIQIARHFGVKTINIVRDLDYWEEPLKKIGADVVLQEGTEWYKDSSIRNIAKLALNSVGGQSAIHLINALEDGGIHVTFGGMTREAVVWPTRDLIFRNISLRGFAVVQYFETERYKDILNLVFDYIKKGVIRIPIEKAYLLKDFKAAIAEAQAYHRKGKILFSSQWKSGDERQLGVSTG